MRINQNNRKFIDSLRKLYDTRYDYDDSSYGDAILDTWYAYHDTVLSQPYFISARAYSKKWLRKVDKRRYEEHFFPERYKRKTTVRGSGKAILAPHTQEMIVDALLSNPPKRASVGLLNSLVKSGGSEKVFNIKLPISGGTLHYHPAITALMDGIKDIKVEKPTDDKLKT